VALRISGLLNYTSYRELFLRAERLTLSRGDGEELGIAGLLKMGEAYWDAFERQKKTGRTPNLNSDATSASSPKTRPAAGKKKGDTKTPIPPFFPYIKPET